MDPAAVSTGPRIQREEEKRTPGNGEDMESPGRRREGR